MGARNTIDAFPVSKASRHPAATAEFRKLGSLLARHTGVPESQAITHLVNKMSVMLMQSLGDMISARVPSHPRPDITGAL